MAFFGSMSVVLPASWIVSSNLPSKSTVHVGKYTVRPMDPMGIRLSFVPLRGTFSVHPGWDG